MIYFLDTDDADDADFYILNLYYQRHLCLKNNQTESYEFMPYFALFEITLHQNK